MIVEFYTWNEIKQMVLLWIIGKSDKLANYARDKYHQLAYEDECNISIQNKSFPEHPDYIDPPKK